MSGRNVPRSRDLCPGWCPGAAGLSAAFLGTWVQVLGMVVVPIPATSAGCLLLGGTKVALGGCR